MITINDLTFKYEHGLRKVFSNLSLNLEEDRIYGLLGKNGTGKSTLLYLISGMLHPTKGSVAVDGTEARRRRPEVLQELFLVPDEFELPPMTLQNYVRLYGSFYPNFSQEVLDSCLKDFETGDVRHLNKLSLGQKKKVMISFALATGTRFLLMDEPTNGLDIPSKSTFRKIIAGNMHDGQTILIATHLAHDVESLLDHLLIAREDGTIFSAPTYELTERYAFVERPSAANDERILYSEPSPQGVSAIVRNDNGAETQLNLEVLFNAVATGAIG